MSCSTRPTGPHPRTQATCAWIKTFLFCFLFLRQRVRATRAASPYPTTGSPETAASSTTHHPDVDLPPAGRPCTTKPLPARQAGQARWDPAQRLQPRHRSPPRPDGHSRALGLPAPGGGRRLGVRFAGPGPGLGDEFAAPSRLVDPGRAGSFAGAQLNPDLEGRTPPADGGASNAPPHRLAVGVG